VMSFDGPFIDVPDKDYLLLRSLVNYAKAKEETEDLETVFRIIIGDVQSTFHRLLVQSRNERGRLKKREQFLKLQTNRFSIP
jgi:hypothetical protein